MSQGVSLVYQKPINKLSDLEGMKILGAPTTAPYLTPFGATVVPSGLPAMYSQLETGVGDGVIIIHAVTFPLKLYEQAKHVTIVDTGPFTFGASGMNLDVFNSLPSEVQDVLKTLEENIPLQMLVLLIYLVKRHLEPMRLLAVLFVKCQIVKEKIWQMVWKIWEPYLYKTLSRRYSCWRYT